MSNVDCTEKVLLSLILALALTLISLAVVYEYTVNAPISVCEQTLPRTQKCVMVAIPKMLEGNNDR